MTRRLRGALSSVALAAVLFATNARAQQYEPTRPMSGDVGLAVSVTRPSVVTCSNGAVCLRLVMRFAPPAIVTPDRPAMLAVQFQCDGPVSGANHASMQFALAVTTGGNSGDVVRYSIEF